MIVNLRGTHGSGKSTAVKKIMERFGPAEVVEQELRPRGAKPLVYRVSVGTGQALFIIGPYETACGGCDGIQPYDRIWPLVDKYAVLGNHVLFEGALISSSYGNIGRSSEVYGDNFVFAFMDTPLDVCLERIAERRAKRAGERGREPKPLDPTNTKFKFDSVLASIPQIRDKFGRRVAMIDHTRPAISTMKLFGVHLRKEP